MAMPEEGNVIGIEAKPGWQLPPARFSEGELLAFFTAHHVMHAPAQKAARLRLHLRPDHYPHRLSKRLATRQPSTSNVKSRRPRHKVRTPGIPSL